MEVDIYPLAEELYLELEKIGMIRRMMDTDQLGVIRVREKKLKKNRYDYIMLQLYFHQLIRKNLQSLLKYTYSNRIKAKEFRADCQYSVSNWTPTMADLLQVLTIICNVGHFYNTFVASRAAIMFAQTDEGFRQTVTNASSDPLYQRSARKMFEQMSYLRYHMLNSMLVLDRCDQSKKAVQVARELIYAYINQDELDSDSKLHYVFEVFRSVRNVAFISFDLEIAQVPLTIDLTNSDQMLVLFRELLSDYNDNRSTKGLVSSMSKLLDDTVYNKESNAICYYGISKRIVNKLRDIPRWDAGTYYQNWLDRDSPFNIQYPQPRKYVKQGILKLTFCREHKEFARELLDELDRFSHVSVGYYDRGSGKQTIVASVNRKNTAQRKIQVAFRVMKSAVRILRKIPGISMSDPRFILAAKFFLFYLCAENPLVIKPTVHRETCVICTKGRVQRSRAVESLINSGVGTEDERYEVCHLLSVLERNNRNEVCISIPASILVYDKNMQGKKMCEFDGMIIYPNRKQEQLVFLEAKNRKQKPSVAKTELIKKLVRLGLPHEADQVEIKGKDAIYPYTLPASLN